VKVQAWTWRGGIFCERAPAMIRVGILAAILSIDHVLAQDDALEQPKHRIFSPNPPACAAETVDNIKKLVDLSVSILPLTKVCAEGTGWAPVSDPWLVEQGLFAPNTHNQIACLSGILGAIGQVCGFTSSILALSFDCFNNNEGCGQSITGVINNFIDVAGVLIQASGFCKPPGQNGGDDTMQGFRCWQSSFKAMQKIVAAAKLIDVAINTCNPTEFSPVLPPEPTNGTDDAAGNTTELLGAMGSQAAANWGGLQQPQPYAEATQNFQVAPVERRLGASSSLEGAVARLGQLRAKLSELTSQIEGEEDDGSAMSKHREVFL